MNKYLTVRYKDKTFKASKRLVDFFYDNLSFDLREYLKENYHLHFIFT